jgi:hypothetical protein
VNHLADPWPNRGDRHSHDECAFGSGHETESCGYDEADPERRLHYLIVKLAAAVAGFARHGRCGRERYLRR